MDIRGFVTLSIMAVCMQLGAKEWALPVVSVANVRDSSSHGAEMTTQVLMGMPLKVTRHVGNGWSHVMTPEGYRGYVIDNSLIYMNDDEMRAWRDTPRLVVTSLSEIKMYSTPDKESEPVSDLVPGNIVAYRDGNENGFIEVSLPDGRVGWVAEDCVCRLDALVLDDVAGKVLDCAVASMGTPYMWGGLSVKGMDCSGLTKHAYLSAGYIIPRDASQQALVGTPVEIDSLKKGDLVFFGNPDTRRINHVAIYEGNEMCIEAAGRVKRTPVNEVGHFIAARRLIGNEDGKGIVAVIWHPWYFNQPSVEENAVD